MNKEQIRAYAKSLGADLCGFASMDRFEGAPKSMDPRYIFPGAKTCVVLAFRIPRGYFRGIEEGTYFSNYTAMGYAGINETYGPIVLRELCCYIEDDGYEAVPVPNIYLHSSVNWADGVDVRDGESEQSKKRSLPVSPDKPRPDVMVDMRAAAYAAGLGEYGWSKVFLTPEFGPMQRFVCLLTDFDCEPDPLFEGKICDKCMSCARMCTGKAISTTESDYIEIAGRKVEFGKIDLFKCGAAYCGGDPRFNPFDVNGVGIANEGVSLESLGLNLYNRHLQAVEGARGCMRECYIHLEKKGVLTKKFKNPFRTQKPWVIDRTKRPQDSVETEEKTGKEYEVLF
ncbi:MAG: hypothetical protein IKT39_01785 [Clostridia bacterium]|nr:hypothetical protein [Clostridia bacterium]